MSVVVGMHVVCWPRGHMRVTRHGTRLEYSHKHEQSCTHGTVPAAQEVGCVLNTCNTSSSLHNEQLAYHPVTSTQQDSSRKVWGGGWACEGTQGVTGSAGRIAAVWHVQAAGTVNKSHVIQSGGTTNEANQRLLKSVDSW
jgi:hypothetical protein